MAFEGKNKDLQTKSIFHEQHWPCETMEEIWNHLGDLEGYITDAFDNHVYQLLQGIVEKTLKDVHEKGELVNNNVPEIFFQFWDGEDDHGHYLSASLTIPAFVMTPDLQWEKKIFDLTQKRYPTTTNQFFTALDHMIQEFHEKIENHLKKTVAGRKEEISEAI